MGVSLYRQYRPQKFSDVSGQAAATEILTRSLAGSRVGHAYLFSGPRGCGKTTLARILAKALNCLSPADGEPCCACRSCQAIAAGESLDVIEIDGASNNSVDEVRELKTHVALAPFSSQYKIYIIDEVHMLSTAAFNALLKTLEEPPPYVVFVLATTEPHKVPVTIRSRCQHIPFHSIGTRQIFDRLRQVAEWEGADAQPEALWEIARQADGALRDALSMLEQVLNRGEGRIRLEDVEATLGGGSRPALERWFAALRGEGSASFTDMQRMMAEGASPERILEELFSLVRNLWLVIRWPDVLDALDVSEQERAFLKEESPHWTESVLRALMSRLVDLLGQARLGLRSDVLVGLLMLGVARAMVGEAELSTVSAAPPRPRREEPPVQVGGPGAPPPPSAPALFAAESPAVRAPAPVPSPPRPEAGTEGAALPEGDWAPLPQETCTALLDLVRREDFVLFCALLDADFQVSDGRLLLELPHRYVYEALSLPRYRSALLERFSRYGGGVFLRCGERVAACLPVQGERADEVPGEAGPAVPPPEAFTVREGSDAPREEGALPALPFDGLVREVSRLMNGEVVLVKRGLDDSDGGALADEDRDDE